MDDRDYRIEPVKRSILVLIALFLAFAWILLWRIDRAESPRAQYDREMALKQETGR